MPPDPKAHPQALTAEALANQLFDAAIMQYQGDPREAARQVIVFMTEAILYTISASVAPNDENARKALLKSVGESIISAPPPAKK